MRSLNSKKKFKVFWMKITNNKNNFPKTCQTLFGIIDVNEFIDNQ